MIIIHNILFLLLLQLLSQAASGLEIPFNDSNIQYFGQWTPFHNSTASRWPGAYFKLSLENTKHVSLQFTNQTTNIITQLDSNPLVYHELNHDNTVVNLTPDLDHELDAGQTHELIVMATEIEPTLCSIHFQALDIDATGRLAKPKQEPPVLVEFIGHDLTLGIGTSKTLFTSFAFLTANDLLKVEHNYVASKSAKLIGGIEDTYFDTVPSSTPWGVVILLGSNDNKSDPDAYHQSLYAFLTRLRLSLDKQSPILVLSEPLGDMYRPTQQAVFDMTHGTEVEHVYFVDTTAWLRYGPTYYLNWTHLNDIGHAMMAQKLSLLLQIKLSNPRDPLPGPPPNPNLPGNWQTMDVGEENRIGLAGTVSADSSTTFTLWGSGADIDNQRDAFRFVYQSFSRQGGIESVVQSHSAFASCAKAGVMIREHFGHGSPMIMLGISPAEGIFVQVRSGNFEPTRVIKKMRASAPYRLALVRKRDDVFEAKIQHIDNESGKGGDWEIFATISNLVMAKDVYAGLAVTSCDVEVVSVAKFTDVSLYHTVSLEGLRFLNQQ